MNELVVVAEIIAKPGREDELKRAFDSIVGPTRGEDGCLQYEPHQDTVEPTRFIFLERWTSRSALDRHLDSPHMKAYFAATEALLAEPVRIVTLHRVA